MLKTVIGLLGIAWFVGPDAVAQQGIDPALIERGQLLYEINCVLCHKESGEGGVPMFPRWTATNSSGMRFELWPVSARDPVSCRRFQI